MAVTQSKSTLHPFTVAGPGVLVRQGASPPTLDDAGARAVLEIANEAQGQRAGDVHFNMSFGDLGWDGGAEPENIKQMILDASAGTTRFSTDIIIKPTCETLRFSARCAGLTGGSAAIEIDLTDEDGNTYNFSIKPTSANNGQWVDEDVDVSIATGVGIERGQWVHVNVELQKGTATGTAELTGFRCQGQKVTSNFPEPDSSIDAGPNVLEQFSWDAWYLASDVSGANLPGNGAGVALACGATAATGGQSTAAWPGGLPAVLINNFMSMGTGGAANHGYDSNANNYTLPNTTKATDALHMRWVGDITTAAIGDTLFEFKTTGNDIIRVRFSNATTVEILIGDNTNTVTATFACSTSPLDGRIIMDINFDPQGGAGSNANVTCYVNKVEEANLDDGAGSWGPGLSAHRTGVGGYAYTGSNSFLGDFGFLGIRQGTCSKADHDLVCDAAGVSGGMP
jgi:hypothetical protein